MEPELRKHNIMLIRQQPDLESSDIGVVLVNGGEATIRQIKKRPQGITLIGFNVTVYPPPLYSNDEIKSLPVRIIGRMVEVRRKY